ncbi:kinase-like domain-containing protein [Rhizophagus irregularis DAOM 181602=DAOM 197198]|uniref:Serine-threonine/tyrosine-protein kinase catalytic domain-containing protein n=1 Tax=Rhizophagus irregularis (strain DAOM 181602 / DAOM 197198 / MUCL 43194) TaxID=747089 RepID=A0A2P4Q0Z1_RHIID|nr:hypothetical protein GLOIN_2v1774866 [Rhizophagus irregularis DAOM 181602=DAOM 197198]POG71282.1 hypothetical protein GLOIN_2v1774866 [Rhizophagus irregularis DAOM 181602=DAOM 197198]GBC25443.2 kinase-like domain-containing protein [Rhizophagus irregularis DAOM 181602=DAOM 197198]|eukprot:XP_025178148.1 hypothetical protein GLOIN_2v1774866 [Rhizophagus irregularis DAOM 181602=DAOM 197198]
MKEHLNYYEYSQFTTIQEIRSGVSQRTFKIQRKVDFHDNVISCHGITKLESENQINNNYMIVIEYADGELKLGASSNFQFKLFGMVPYVDPKSFSRRRNNNNLMYTLNDKSEHYDIGLIYNISQGRREIVVPDTPDEYVKTFILLKCWDGEPDNRPTIYRVVDFLKAIITKTDIIMENPQLLNEQELNEIPLSTNNLESRGELSQLIQNFDKMNTKEIDI